jgi:hypothetical protein
MTILISSLAPEFIVYVSDTRLSYLNRVDDIARKVLFYVPRDARLIVAYTGLAEFRDETLAAQRKSAKRRGESFRRSP